MKQFKSLGMETESVCFLGNYNVKGWDITKPFKIGWAMPSENVSPSLLPEHIPYIKGSIATVVCLLMSLVVFYYYLKEYILASADARKEEVLNEKKA